MYGRIQRYELKSVLKEKMRTQKVRNENEKRTTTRNSHGHNDCLVELIGGRHKGILLVTVLYTRGPPTLPYLASFSKTSPEWQ